MTTGQMIEKERIKAGLTQTELGKMLNISAAAVSRYELGQRQVTISTLSKIADALDIPISALIADNEPESLSVGQRIKQERVNAGLTQIELSKKINIAVNSLRLYEANKRVPTVDTIEKIAFALNIPASVFVEKNPSNCFSHAQFQVIKNLAQVAIENHLNPRPSAFVPTKEQVEILKSIISQIE